MFFPIILYQGFDLIDRHFIYIQVQNILQPVIWMYTDSLQVTDQISWNEVVAVDIENYIRSMLRVEERIEYLDLQPIESNDRNTVLPHIKLYPPLMRIQSLPAPAILNKYIQNK